jgi:hypothetical protein
MKFAGTKLCVVFLCVLLEARSAVGFILSPHPSGTSTTHTFSSEKVLFCPFSQLSLLSSNRDRQLSLAPRESESESQIRLRPAKDALQRILWDPQLQKESFTVGFVDRFANGFTEVKCDAPNTSIKGPSRLFVLALPEHRIEYIKFLRRVVWHKADRIDRIFGSGRPLPDGSFLRIEDVIRTYDEWFAAAAAQSRKAWGRVNRVLEEDKAAECKLIFAQLLRGDLSADQFVSRATSPALLGADGGAEA